MAHAAPMNLKWFSGFIPTAKQAVFGLVAIVATVLITSYVNRGDNFELTFKNQELGQLQKFQASGATLDTSFRTFNDALSDNSKIDVARDQLRAAIAQHASDVFADQSLLGERNVASYMNHLARFRDLVDVSTRPTNAIPMAQAGLDLIVERKALIDLAESKIGIAPKASK